MKIQKTIPLPADITTSKTKVFNSKNNTSNTNTCGIVDQVNISKNNLNISKNITLAQKASAISKINIQNAGAELAQMKIQGNYLKEEIANLEQTIKITPTQSTQSQKPSEALNDLIQKIDEASKKLSSSEYIPDVGYRYENGRTYEDIHSKEIKSPTEDFIKKYNLQDYKIQFPHMCVLDFNGLIEQRHQYNMEINRGINDHFQKEMIKINDAINDLGTSMNANMQKEVPAVKDKFISTLASNLASKKEQLKVLQEKIKVQEANLNTLVNAMNTKQSTKQSLHGVIDNAKSKITTQASKFSNKIFKSITPVSIKSSSSTDTGKTKEVLIKMQSLVQEQFIKNLQHNLFNKTKLSQIFQNIKPKLKHKSK